MTDESQGVPNAPEGGQPAPPPAAPQVPQAPGAPQQAPPAGQAPPSGAPDDTAKLLAAGGYIVGIIAVIAILIDPYKAMPYSRHHAVQAIGLWVVTAVVSIAASILGIIPFIGWLLAIMGALVGLAAFVVAIIAAIKAFQGEMWEMPVVYGFVKQYI
jgi:uncharacterized membrane protein